ncbi:MAG: hypothetical protein PHI31_10825 [Desulfuromonadaceae bacterium]|nr:hypothetical protein [Desulfuromonadaceae bacterium]
MNRWNLLLMSLITTLFGYATVAKAIEGYPGSTWGEIRQDIPNQKGKDGPYNVVGQGYIEQGIDWERWGEVFFNSYLTVRYKYDTMRYDWNNSVSPGAGLDLAYFDKSGNTLRLGLEHSFENFFNNGRVEEKTMVYVRWYKSWNLKQ